MKIAVVLLSDGHAALAGARIRYQRITQPLQALGHSLDIMSITEFSANRQPEHDLYLFSKCEDARSLILARQLRRQGRHVGIDGFDDYFSQHDDSRHVRHREWLRAIAPYCDFFLTSTPRMRDVFQSYMPDVPGHVLNDPFDAFEGDAVADLVEAKLHAARTQGRIMAAWFGVGDHPSFNVGLHDLSAHAQAFRVLQRRGFDVRLRVLTNRRALTPQGLALLGRIDVPFTVDEWSLSAENRLLAESLVAFIPVSAQSFSIAKSLNRSVTALTAGAQVLSPAYPLYEPLGDFIYNSADSLADDVRDGRLKVSRTHIKALTKALTRWGDPVEEAGRLARFLTRLPPIAADGAALWGQGQGGLIHGCLSPNVCMDLARAMNHLSVTLPFNEDRKSDDVRFIRHPHGLQIRVSSAAEANLGADVRKRFKTFGQRLDAGGFQARLKDILPDSSLEAYMIDHPAAATPLLSDYAEGVSVLRDVLAQITPDVTYFLSEKSPPFRERPLS
ncbi:hypothetical protein D3C71_267140 [compost metagenome]